MIKVSTTSGDEEKNINHRARRDHRVFCKNKKRNHFVDIGFSLPFHPRGLKSGGWMERRQRPQRSFLVSPLVLLTFRQGWKRGQLFALHPGPEPLAISASAFSATSAVRFF
jgi:hypothetical protein